MLAASGCFQSMSNDGGPTPPSNLFATDTPLPPSQTPQPTFTPFPTGETSVQTVIVTATPNPEVTADAFDVASSDELSVDVEVQQEPTISSGQLEATRIIAEATQRSLDATSTALGPVLPTFTPTFEQAVFTTPTPDFNTAGPITTTGTCTHTVVAGDNLFQLSMQYGVLIVDIANANGITNPQLIVVGDVLNIPGCNSGGFNQTGTTTGTGTTSVGCPGRGIQHTVAQNETLFQLSLQYDVPIADIAACNNISNYNLIVYSTVLTIP